MTDKAIWDKEVPIPQSTITFVDEAIAKKLPKDNKIVGITPSGASYWARTAKIETTDPNGEEESFFVKVHQGEYGKTMFLSQLLRKASYESIPDTHFFLCRFHELSDDIPNLSDFPSLVAEMHKRGVSPDGKFGFPIATFGGNKKQFFPVSDTWEECYSKGLKQFFENDMETHGPDEEFERLSKAIFTAVIPRPLRPLETEGRTITPSLVHGDLWDGNASVDVATGMQVIFDATPLYAHNEYELGPWTCPRHRTTKSYVDEYTKHFVPSEPSKEFDDRRALYSLRFDMLSSSLYPGNLRFRILARETMVKLLEKYSEGFEGYAKKKGLVPLEKL